MNRRTAVIALALFPVLALAHHGWSEYDSTKLLKLSGQIVESGYEHPHGFIRLDTPGKTWLCLLAPPSRMEARGLAKDLLQPTVDQPLQSVHLESHHIPPETALADPQQPGRLALRQPLFVPPFIRFLESHLPYLL